eukprot:TRINITY_DN2185_c0_g1_i2.p1 TRINITY_DN2185_c0_g1~~TRINITY_DN2185_c0_g1_i2.p1  ORF type:complete len:140 (-),score=27.34 TRINITY_DN2185_c0_g1_i2:929-1348(-)
MSPASAIYWEESATYAARAIDCLLTYNDLNDFKRLLININFPNVAPDQIKGWKLTQQGTSWYKDWYVETKRDQGNGHPDRKYYLLKGELKCEETSTDFDTSAMMQGFISVSVFPLSFYKSNEIILVAEGKISKWDVFQS